MALAYLLDPSFQTLNENGRPLVGGHIEVYYHNTSIKYVTKADFEGTDNPFKVPLNSKGMAVIIASDQYAYDVFCYDRFGALYWSRQNVSTIGGSGGGGTTYIAGNGISISEENEIAVKTDNSTIHVNSSGELEVIGGGSSVPLVRVVFQNGAWSKISGDDGFIKNNPYGTPSLYLPEYGWWWFHTGISVHNPTPRDLIQHLQLKWTRYVFIEEGVPPAFYDEPNLPSLTYEADFTRSNTNNRSGTSLYEQNTNRNHWFGVSLTAYNDTLPNDLEYAIWVELIKVRDA